MSGGHNCPACGTTRNIPDLNDDASVSPKIRLDELVKIEGHGEALYRIMKIQGVVLEMEKV